MQITITVETESQADQIIDFLQDGEEDMVLDFPFNVQKEWDDEEERNV
jgi:hypothetical protein